MSPSTVSPEVASISFTDFYNIVDGKPRVSQEVYHGTSSETEEKLWDAPVAQQQDVEDAVTAANKAFPAWSRRTIDERAKAVKAWNGRLISLATEFIELSTKEGGKPVSNIVDPISTQLTNQLTMFSRKSLPSTKLNSQPGMSLHIQISDYRKRSSQWRIELYIHDSYPWEW